MGLLKTKPEAEIEATTVDRELKRSKWFGWRDVIVCLLIVGFFLVTKNTIGGTHINPVLEETQFGVIGVDGKTRTFVYSDIEEIHLYNDLSNFQRGKMIDGTETKRCYSGTFQNEEFGEYQLQVETKIQNYIVVRDSVGVIVFNIEADDTTQILYDFFVEQMNAQK